MSIDNIINTLGSYLLNCALFFLNPLFRLLWWTIEKDPSIVHGNSMQEAACLLLVVPQINSGVHYTDSQLDWSEFMRTHSELIFRISSFCVTISWQVVLGIPKLADMDLRLQYLVQLNASFTASTLCLILRPEECTSPR